MTYLLAGGDPAIICYEGGTMMPLPFDHLDMAGKKLKTRSIDITSEYYRAARSYMLRLNPEDFTDKESLEGLARAAKMTPEEFRKRYDYLVA